MATSEKWYLVLGMFVPLFFLGLLFLCLAIRGMRRGEFHYKSAWFHKGDDGWVFWVITFTCAASGVATMVATIWLGLVMLK
jgi:hypothetical protein